MMHIVAHEKIDGPLAPLARMDERVPFHYAPRRGQQ